VLWFIFTYSIFVIGLPFNFISGCHTQHEFFVYDTKSLQLILYQYQPRIAYPFPDFLYSGSSLPYSP
jgi:hypothetical protein